MGESVETVIIDKTQNEMLVDENETTTGGENENLYGGNDSESEGAQEFEFGGFYEEGSESISEPPIPTGEVRASAADSDDNTVVSAKTTAKQSNTKKATASMSQSATDDVDTSENEAEEVAEVSSNEIEDEGDMVMTTASTVAVVEPMGLSEDAILTMAHLTTAVVAVAAIGMMALNFVKKK